MLYLGWNHKKLTIYIILYYLSFKDLLSAYLDWIGSFEATFNLKS